MPISKDTHVVLDVHSPKKDAVFGNDDPDLLIGTDDCAVWLNSIPNHIEKTQYWIGALDRLHNYIQSEMLKDTAVEQVASTTLAGNISDITAAPPGTGEVGLYVGSWVAAGDRSHYLDRTYKRIRERLLELAKGGVEATPS